MAEQAQAVRGALASLAGPASATQVAAALRVPKTLDTSRVGMVQYAQDEEIEGVRS